MAHKLWPNRASYEANRAKIETWPADEQQIAFVELCKNDLFFLLVYGLDRTFADTDWFFDRCREIQKDPNGHIDLWAREHGKSTTITIALTIQNILNDPEITVGIFSHTRPIAKSFMRVIKREFELNEKLKLCFSDILWTDPHKESPKWNEDEGIVVKRKGNPPEATVEACGSAMIPECRRSQLPTIKDNPGRLDKVARANLVSHLVRDGILWLPESRSPSRKGYPMSWLSAWHEQMLYFPNTAHDDGVDACTMGLNVLDRMGFIKGKSLPTEKLSYWKKQLKVSPYG